MREISVVANSAGKRVDKYLIKLLGNNINRSDIYKYIRTKHIKINNKRTLVDYRLQLNDKIQFYNIDYELLKFQSPPQSTVTIKHPKVNAVYEDDNIIVIDKPVGMIVHSDINEKINTLIDHIKAYLVQKEDKFEDCHDGFVPALCNRIDRNTSGLVIAAKNNEALLAVNRIIKNHELTKKYRCLVFGVPKNSSGRISNYLLKDSKYNTVEVVNKMTDGARKAVTLYKVIEIRNGMSLLEVEIITGRTHQIRAHMQYIGHPIVGDSKYGSKKINKKNGYKYQALHSYQIRFHGKLSEPSLKYLSGQVITSKLSRF